MTGERRKATFHEKKKAGKKEKDQTKTFSIDHYYDVI